MERLCDEVEVGHHEEDFFSQACLLHAFISVQIAVEEPAVMVCKCNSLFHQ